VSTRDTLVDAGAIVPDDGSERRHVFFPERVLPLDDAARRAIARRERHDGAGFEWSWQVWFQGKRRPRPSSTERMQSRGRR
jgi:hypothetical protein